MSKKLFGFLLALGLLGVMPLGSSYAAESELPSEEALVLEAVTVTAQKRTQVKTDVPISLEVKNERQLEAEGIRDTKSLLDSVPNVGFEQGTQASAPYIAIRGVGTDLVDSDPTVGLFVDGIPMFMSNGYLSNLLDIGQVEVLRGPQGTLYGRNTLGGAINMYTNKPDPTEYSGHVKLGGGLHENIMTEIVGNIPLVEDRSALRFAFAFDHMGRKWENKSGERVGGHDNFMGRLSFFQKLGESTTLDFSADLQIQNQVDGNVMTLEEYRAGKREVNMSDPYEGYNNSGGAKLEINTDFDNGYRFTSLTGYRRVEHDTAGDPFPEGYESNLNAMFGFFGFTGYHMFDEGRLQETLDLVTQEFRLTSPDDQDFRFVLGLYGDYSNTQRTNSQEDSWTTNPFGWASDHVTMKFASNQRSVSLAAFADGSYDFDENWEVFGGVRVGYDFKEFSYKGSDNLGNQYLDSIFLSASGTQLIKKYDDTWEHVYITPRFGIKYKFNENNNIYASVSRGYKSGGFFNTVDYDKESFSFDEETTWNYELGMKNTFFDGHLTIDSALFYIDWQGQQVFSYNPATLTFSIDNAPRSRSYGFEIDAKAQFDNGIRLGLSAGYADATYVEYDDARGTLGGFIDAAGKQQQYHSKFTGRANLGYDVELPWDELVASFDVFYRYRSNYYLDVQNKIEQDGYGTMDVNIAVGNDTYEVALWAKNLFNVQAMSSAFDGGGQWATMNQDYYVTLTDPFSFGASIKVMF